MQTSRQQCYQLLLREEGLLSCQKHLSDEVSWWHPDQMPASPTWALLEAKEQ